MKLQSTLLGLLASIAGAEQITHFEPSRINSIAYDNNSLFISNNQYTDTEESFSYNIYELDLESKVKTQLSHTDKNHLKIFARGGRVLSVRNTDRFNETLVSHKDGVMINLAGRIHIYGINTKGDALFTSFEEDTNRTFLLKSSENELVELTFPYERINSFYLRDNGNIIVNGKDESWIDFVHEYTSEGDFLGQVPIQINGSFNEREIRRLTDQFTQIDSFDENTYERFSHIIAANGETLIGGTRISELSNIGDETYSFSLDTALRSDQDNFSRDDYLHLILHEERVYEITDKDLRRQRYFPIAFKNENEVFVVRDLPHPLGSKNQVFKHRLDEIAKPVEFGKVIPSVKGGSFVIRYIPNEGGVMTLDESIDLKNWYPTQRLNDISIPEKTMLHFEIRMGNSQRFYRFRTEQ